MRRVCHLVVMVGVLALLTAGFAQTAAAQSPSNFQNASQYCSQYLEPTLASDGIPMSHSTCVTLVNGSNGYDVGVCKWARDVGAIANNQLGACVSKGIPNLGELIMSALEAKGVPADVIDGVYGYLVEVVGVPEEALGPSGLSMAVFTCMLGIWLMVQWRRRKAFRP